MTTRPGPSTDRILETVQHFLVAAVSVVVAVVIIVAFLRVVAADSPADGTDALAESALPSDAIITPGTEAPSDIVVVDPGAPTTTTTMAPTSCDRSEPTAGAGEMVLRIFMPCGGPDVPNTNTYVYRVVPETTALLTTTMQLIVSGPTAEERSDGFTSPWSSATANAINSVQLADGAVLVNFGTPVTSLTGIDAEPARSFLLAEIYSSLFQYERVTSVELRLGSDCAAFFALVGDSACTVVDRGGWDAQLAQWQSEG